MNKKWFRVLYISGLISGVLWWTPESQVLNPVVGGVYSRGLLYILGQIWFYAGIFITVIAFIFLIKRIEIKNTRNITKTLITLVLTIILAFSIGAILGLFILSPRIIG